MINDNRTTTPTYRRLAFALYCFWVLGTIGLLIDGDHVVAVLSRGFPINPTTILLFGARIWHWGSVVISGSLFVTALALYMGLLVTSHAILDTGQDIMDEQST